MNFNEAKKRILDLYSGQGWPSLFSRIRFFTAPFESLVKLVPERGVIIDIGCGYGIFANLLGVLGPERQILGIDQDEYKMRHVNRTISNVRFIVGDATAESIPEADCILLVHVLHHLNSYQEQEELIIKCVRKINSGGRLIIAEVDKKPWWKFVLAQIADHLLYPGDKIYYRFPVELEPILTKSGLTFTKHISHYDTPFSHITYDCLKS